MKHPKQVDIHPQQILEGFGPKRMTIFPSATAFPRAIFPSEQAAREKSILLGRTLVDKPEGGLAALLGMSGSSSERGESGRSDWERSISSIALLSRLLLICIHMQHIIWHDGAVASGAHAAFCHKGPCVWHAGVFSRSFPPDEKHARHFFKLAESTTQRRYAA